MTYSRSDDYFGLVWYNFQILLGSDHEPIYSISPR